MVLTYEFGGDDDHPGDDWEYEVDYDQRCEAIAHFMAEDYIHSMIRKTKASDEQAKKLRGSTKIVSDIICSILKDYYEDAAYREYTEYKDSSPF